MNLRILASLLAFAFAADLRASGTLTPKGSPHSPIAIRNHAVDISIRDGFARTEVRQTFSNPNSVPLEAIYSFPLPKSAALSDVSVMTGEEIILRGEVIARDDAQRVYREERDAGNDAAIAEKDGYRTFDFTIANVKPGIDTTICFVYYQRIAIDTGVGRYLYPLQSGGTDDARAPFWEVNDAVDGEFSLRLELHSTYPVEKVFAPGFESATVTTPSPEIRRFEYSSPNARLDRDFVFYYALEDGLPGRVEVVPFRASTNEPGTFMVVVTPGTDLAPLTHGCDHTFVLDVSGSMSGKLAMLANGVVRSLQALRIGDRFRIITFGSNARVLTGGFLPVTPESVAGAIDAVTKLASGGSTNLEAGVKLALGGLEQDRTQSIVLVTDGVANSGAVDPRSFVSLLEKVDVRIFAFLLGNEANWPLVETIAEVSGGFYESISNADDIASRLALVKPKLTHQAMTAVELEFDGDAEPFDVDATWIGNVYAGQQIAVFGRYRRAGSLDAELRCRIGGQERTYTTRVTLPDLDATAPEIERLFAVNRVETLERASRRGLEDENEVECAVRDLGVRYQIVTDQTSMIVLSDGAFERRGIARNNRTRVDAETAAAQAQAGRPVTNRRADSDRPMFDAPSFSRRSGSFDGILVALSGCLLWFVLHGSRGRRAA